MSDPVNMAKVAKEPVSRRRLLLLLLIMLVLLLLTVLLAGLPEREVVLPGGITLTHTHAVEVAEDTGYLTGIGKDPYLVLQTPETLASVTMLGLEVVPGPDTGMAQKPFVLYFQPEGRAATFNEACRLSSTPAPGPAGRWRYVFNLPEAAATCRLDPPAGLTFRIQSLTWQGYDGTGKAARISIIANPPQASVKTALTPPKVDQGKPAHKNKASGSPPPVSIPAATSAAPVPRAEATAVGLRRECCQLQEQIKSLPQQQRPEVLGLRLRAQYILEDLEVWARAWQKAHESGVRQRLNALQRHLSGLQQNGTYLAADSTYLMAHQSPLDDSLQPYALSIGKGIDPRTDGVHPLVVYLHGQGMYRSRQFAAPRWPGYIVVGPQGRGGMDYRYVGEVDVLRVIEQATELLPVDPNRIVLAGASMGGTGCWNLASRFPDRFAGIAAVNGITGITGITPTERQITDSQKVSSPQQQIRHFLRQDTAPVSRAGNLLHLSVRAWHGMDDPINPAANALKMRAALQDHKHPRLNYHLVPYGLHHISVNYPAAVQDFVRTPTPEHISLSSAWLKYGQAWWVRYDALEDPLRPARVDGNCENDGSRVVLTTENLKALTILPRFMPGRQPPRRVIIDGTALWIKADEGSHSKDRQLHFYRINPDGPWLAREEPEAENFPPSKTGALEGPVEHAFMSRFLVVLPDPPAANAKAPLVRAARKAGLAFDRWWRHRFSVPCRQRMASEVTESDLADSNLILYGGPGENPLVKQVIGKLPVRPLPGGILVGEERLASSHLGARLCFPNPLNPDRYVVLTFGLTPESYDQVHRRFGNWFDWVPYFHRDHYDFAVWDTWTTGKDPETFIRWGFFDQSWRLDPELTFTGVVDLRQSLRPYVAPAIGRAALAEVRRKNPDKAVPVEMLEPVVSTVAKDCIERRRNQHGGDLQLAGQTYEYGLSLTYPAKLVLPCAGYRQLKGDFGLQWDGKAARTTKGLLQAEPEITVMIGGKNIMTLKHITLSKPALNVAIPLLGAEEVTLVISGGPPWGGETLVMGNTFLVP